MNNRGEGRVWKLAGDLTVVLAVAVIVGTFSLLSARGFIVPEDTALRIRLDDTLTSTDSQVGDPFSATVVDQGDYRNARVRSRYGDRYVGEDQRTHQYDASFRPPGHARRPPVTDPR